MCSALNKLFHTSAIRGIGCSGSGDFFFITVTNSQQHFLGVVQITAFLPVVFQDVGLND